MSNIVYCNEFIITSMSNTCKEELIFKLGDNIYLYWNVFFILTAFALVSIVWQKAFVFEWFLDSVPIDALRVAQIFVLQNGDRAGIDLLQRAKTEGYQGGLDDVQRREVFRERSATDHFEVPKVREVLEIFVVPLNIKVARDLFQRFEDL